MDVNDEILETLLHHAHTGHYINSATHDLNNMLGAIMAYAELIQMEVTDPEVVRMTQEIVAASEKGSRLLDALTAIARPLQLDLAETCHAGSIIDAVTLLFSYDINRMNVEATFEVDENITDVAMSGHVLERIVTRLMDNAMDALSGVEDRKLSLLVREIDDTISISLQDSGGGVAKEIESHIFDEAFTTKEAHMGMGLALARKLAHAYNATLDYSTDTGFVLRVPVAKAASDEG